MEPAEFKKSGPESNRSRELTENRNSTFYVEKFLTFSTFSKSQIDSMESYEAATSLPGDYPDPPGRVPHHTTHMESIFEVFIL